MTCVFPVILSGGAGTRLWPLSRAMYPKQFIRFFEGDDTSFLGSALRRLPQSEGFGAPILLCNNDHRFLVREELEKASIAPQAIVLEPVARNTAPAIAAAAFLAVSHSEEAVITVMPSDHVIADTAQFVADVRAAAKVAATGRLVLFGVTPTEPHTGYGYLSKGAPVSGSGGAFEVASFFEKPDLETATRYLADGGFYWNSGIFVLHARTFLEELQKLAPDIHEAVEKAVSDSHEDLGFLRLEKTAFAEAPGISIDYAIMEKTKKAAMLPVEFGWNDVGSWSSLWDISVQDDDGNFVRGEAVLEDTKGCFIHSDKALVSTIGLEDLVIVNTPDALLVTERSRAQDVGKIVQKLKDADRKEHLQHLRNLRPWGHFETLSLNPRFQVKKLHVKPGAKLSMQMHHHRSEHWIVVQGTALVVIDGTEQLLRENESIYISATQWHRLENPGKLPLELIEVQIGSYLGEDDIIRADDIYHRDPEETK